MNRSSAFCSGPAWSWIAVSLLALDCFATRAEAADLFWFGAQDNNWTTVGNWGLSTSPDSSVPANGDTLRWLSGRSTQNLSMNNDYPALRVTNINSTSSSSVLPAGIVFGGNKLTWTGYIDTQNSGIVYNLPLEAGDTFVTIIRGGTFNGVISEAVPNSVIDFASGTISLTGDSTWTGPAQLSTSVTISSLRLKANPQALGQGDVLFGYLSGASSTAGTLIYTGPATSTDKGFMIGRNNSAYETRTNTFRNNGTGAVTWTGPQNKATGNIFPQTFELGGTNTDANDMQASLADNSASSPISIRKSDAGRWSLSGTNTYSGTTSVDAGTLLIKGDQSGAAGLITVAADAVIGGSGTIGGGMTLLNDARFFFDPAATLTVSGSGAIDLGNLSLAKLDGLTSSVALGTYDLINGTGILDTQNVQNFGQGGQASIGDNKFAYFDAPGQHLSSGDRARARDARPGGGACGHGPGVAAVRNLSAGLA